MARIDDLRTQLAELQGGGNNMNNLQRIYQQAQAAVDNDYSSRGMGAGSGMATAAGPGYMSMLARRDAALRALNQARSQQGNASNLQGDIAFLEEQEAMRQEAEANRQAGLDLTEGRMQDILDDPYMASALAQQQSLMENPAMNDQAVGAMYTRLADMAANSQQTMQDQLSANYASRGMSALDPSAQAASREMMEQRQLSNQGNMRDLLIQQAITNWGQQQQASGQLMNMRSGQQNLAQGPANIAAGQYWNTYDTPESQYRQTPEGLRQIGGQTYRTPAPSVPSQGSYGGRQSNSNPSYGQPYGGTQGTYQGVSQPSQQQNNSNPGMIDWRGVKDGTTYNRGMIKKPGTY